MDGRTYPTQRVMWKARCKSCTITAVTHDSGWPRLRVDKTPLFVNCNAALYSLFHGKTNEEIIGLKVYLVIRQLLLSEGTDDERLVWDATARYVERDQ